MYRKFWKRIIDFSLALIGLILLSPIMLVLVVIGAVAMKGSPFFTQLRPGKDEKIFRLIKFRTMTNEKDENGNLLPDEKRLNSYGKFLRSTSLDELPQLVNIIKGDMSIVGPRPLLVEYLPYYSEKQRHRHDVRPGLTGLAQVMGRNSVDWDTRFSFDTQYSLNVTMKNDLKIIILTFKSVFSRSDISENTRETEGNFADIRKAQMALEDAKNDETIGRSF